MQRRRRRQRMRHYAFRANGAKRNAAVTALGIAAAAGLMASRPAHAQITFTPPPDAPAGGVNYIGVKEVHYGAQGGGDGSPSIGDQNVARTNLVSPATNARISRYNASGLNILDTGTDGIFNTGNVAFGVERAETQPRVGNTINVASGDINDIATLSRGVVRVATAGLYTFAVASD